MLIVDNTNALKIATKRVLPRGYLGWSIPRKLDCANGLNSIKWIEQRAKIMSNNHELTANNLEKIDSALKNSTAELQRLATVYQQLGFRKEARDILSTVTRIQEHMNGTESQSREERAS